MDFKKIIALITSAAILTTSVGTDISAVATATTKGAEDLIVISECECSGECINDDTELMSHIHSGGIAPMASNLPNKFDISSSGNSYKKYLPPVKKQKPGTCTAYSVCYTQYSYEVNRMLDRQVNGEDTYYSPMLPFNLLKGQEPGIYVEDAYAYLKFHGDLLWSEFNEELAQMPTEDDISNLREALNIRAMDYESLNLNATIQIKNVNSPEIAKIKDLLVNGHILRVTSSYRWNKAGNNQEILYRCMDNGNSYHSFIIVGYDDTLTYDINGNGYIEAAEKGALKIMNSWGVGDGKNGYSWVMYDALNLVSAVSNNAESKTKYKNTTRVPAFGGGSNNNNWFTWIDVERRDVNMIGEITYTAKDRSGITFSLHNGSSWVETIWNKKEIGKANQLVTLFDYDDYANVLACISSGEIDERIKSKYASNNSLMSSCRWRITDNLGKNIVPETGKIIKFASEGCQYVGNNAKINLPLGDVDYSGVFNSGDVTFVLRYVANLESFSNLQKFLGDFNKDGIVDSSDATAMLIAIAN